jgi:Family of unknown function (DUF6529)
MTARSVVSAPAGRAGAALALMAGSAVALSLGVYARLHHAAQRPLFLLGFSGMLQLKTWLTTAALLLVLVQLGSALWMWGRLPGAGAAPAWISPVHRWSGSLAFLLTVPVALHCVWALGLVATSPRVYAHGALGCLFYGAYSAKMLGLRLRGLPGWALPVLGGAVFTLFVLLWATSALWFLTRPGVPLL